jgi:hypothetical protein
MEMIAHLTTIDSKKFHQVMDTLEDEFSSKNGLSGLFIVNTLDITLFCLRKGPDKVVKWARGQNKTFQRLSNFRASDDELQDSDIAEAGMFLQ